MKKIKLMLIMGVLLVFITGLASAHGDFTEAKKFVEGKVSCGNLTDEQIEEVGDYLMELMHPGDAHIQMHEMMGGEDSKTVKLMHVNMAKMMYCNEGEGMSNMMGMMSGSGMMGSGSGGMMSGDMAGGSGGMMGMMPMMMNTMGGGNMMSSGGMMGNYYQNPQNSNSYQNNFIGFQIFYYVLLILVIVILVLIMLLLINKMKKQGRNNKHGRQ